MQNTNINSVIDISVTTSPVFLSISDEDIPLLEPHGYDREAALLKSVERREAGERFIPVDEFMSHMRAAIKEGAVNNGRA